MKKFVFITTGVLALFLAGIVPAQAGTTKTWIATTGDWFADGNWAGGGHPVVGDDVVITNAGASVLLTNSTEYLSSIVISNTTILVFSNWNTKLSATNVYVRTNATVTLPPAFTNNAMSNNVYIICSNLTMDAGGKIDADGKGYDKSSGGSGYGPGAGSGYGSAGSYGGLGGNGTTTYGSSSAPIDPGSAAGYYNAPYPGAAGGGAVRLQANGLIAINGTITANGADDGQAASGGGIYIICRTLRGTNGTVRANGGSGNTAVGGGGGGGRIAVIYDSSAQSLLPVPNVLFSAAGGPGSVYGDIGTLYFSDTRFITETISYSGQVIIPGFTNWAPNNLVISNGWIRFPWDAFQLAVTNAVTVVGTDARIHKLEVSRLNCGGPIVLTNGSLIIKGLAAVPVLTCSQNITLTNSQLTLNGAATTGLTMNCGGNLILTNGSAFSVYSGRTNASGANYGAWVNIASNVSVATNAWIYPYSNPTNGGSPLFYIRNLTVDAGGGINADGKGFTIHNGSYGYGPGGGNGMASGGSYGGLGGNGTKTYGSSNAPIDPGSGGGYYNDPYPGTAGGGVVRLQSSGVVTINGIITANGKDASSQCDSAGSGGGIYITCRTLSGANGIVRANGAIGGTLAGYGGGGGGGRIALWRINDMPLISISTAVIGGAGSAANGTNGTVVLGWLPAPGTVFYGR